MERIDSLIRQTVTLPSLPAIVVHLNDLLQRQLASMGEVSELIGKDPALTARILRLVNSPIYSFRGKIDSLQRAITMIGVRELRNLATAASVRNVFAGMPNEIISMDTFWRHSLITGLYARIIAETAGQRELDKYFVMGLLHDVGALILFHHFPEKARRAARLSEQEGIPIVHTERSIIGFSHADVGGVLMRRWHLPENIATAVEHHHNRKYQGEHLFDVAVVRLSNLLANQDDNGGMGLGARMHYSFDDWQAVGIGSDMSDTLRPRVQERFEATRDALLGS